MIFDINKTSLGSDVAVIEGYDYNTGFAQMMIESAQNDLAMFKSMLNIDAREIAMRKSGTVNESELSALNEAAAKGILEKIADMLQAFASKLKGIFEKFVDKLMTIAASDAGLVKKYKKKVLDKGAILNEMKIKWRGVKNDAQIFRAIDHDIMDVLLDPDNYDDDEATIFNNVSGYKKDEFNKEYAKTFFTDDEAKEIKFSEAGVKMEDIINWIEKYGDNLKAYKDASTKLCKSIQDEAKKLKGEAKKADEANAEEANKKYKVAKAVQEYINRECKISMDVIKEIHKQYRSVFAKAITFNGKNEEDAQKVSEAAEEEVEDVIAGAIDTVDALDDISIATYDVKDDDVSDDPNKLVYDKVDTYTSQEEPEKDGEVDIDINAKIGGKSEAAFFGELLY